jgi:hypothetical protein
MRIPARFAGPPGSANGGVAAGRLAAYVDATVVEVTLRRPPRLDVELAVEDGRLLDGDVLVAQAGPGTVDVDPGPVVTPQAAAAASAGYPGYRSHPFPGCFVCGTDREPPDGLGLRPGPVGPALVAAPWTPTAADPWLVWAALDCPGSWSADVPGRNMVLGRMTLRLDRLPVVGDPHVVTGWTLGAEGRKTSTATALRDADGRLLALAQATWLTVDPRQLGLERP